MYIRVRIIQFYGNLSEKSSGRGGSCTRAVQADFSAKTKSLYSFIRKLLFEVIVVQLNMTF